MMTQTHSHWAMQYLGKPWESGAQGPDTFNCWGLVRHVQRTVFNRHLPLIMVDDLDPSVIIDTFQTHGEYVHWQQVDVPSEGDCVITKSSPTKPEHVGIWVDVDGGRILQAVYGSGVVLASARATRKIIGQHLEFWRYAS
jgi:cell wall-associated NlpC family hydrolase